MTNTDTDSDTCMNKKNQTEDTGYISNNNNNNNNNYSLGIKDQQK